MGHIWPYMVHIWPYMAHIWPIYGPYMAIYGPYMAIYGHMSQNGRGMPSNAKQSAGVRRTTYSWTSRTVGEGWDNAITLKRSIIVRAIWANSN